MGTKAILAGVTVSLVALCAANANAADVANPGSWKDYFNPDSSVGWTGFYVGFTGGYGGGTSRNYVSNNNNPHGWAENDPDGAVLGGTIGYNYQFAPNWVAGAEADFSWSGMEGQQHMYIYDGHDWSGGWDGFATLRARLGYAVGHNLFYGTAGLAFVHANEVIVGNDSDESDFYQGWKTGYVIGAGVEHVFTDRISAKLEYLFADGFGSESGPTGTVAEHGDQWYKHTIGDISIVRVGINYKLY
jgi:outer membrane immunogenic protein